MKKNVVLLVFLLLLFLSSWSATNKTVIVAITDVDGGSGPSTAGDYGFQAWVADRTQDVLDNSSAGCAIIPVADQVGFTGTDYSGYCVNIDAGNFSSWVNGETLYLKVWENDTPVDEQPQATKSFTLNNDPAQVFDPASGIVLYNPPLPVTTPSPANGASIVSGEVDDTTLGWDDQSGGNSTDFDIYLSTNLENVTNLESSALKAELALTDLTNETLFPHNPDLGFSKTYYWRVVSKSSTSNITSNGTIWSFVTPDEVIELPVTTGETASFVFSGGEGGEDVIPANVGFTPNVVRGGTRDAGIVTVRKYETPPATVPCPEYALNVLFELDLTQYSGDSNVTIKFVWTGVGFAENPDPDLYYYNGTWNIYDETTPLWDKIDDADSLSVEFTTTNINSYKDGSDITTWMIGDGSSSSPLQPTIPQISSVAKNGSNLDVSWAASMAADNYDIYSTTDPYGGSWTFVETVSTGTNWSVALNSETNYFYKIKAKDSGGTLESDDSDIAGYVKYSLEPTAQTDNNIIVYSMDMGFEDAEDLRSSITDCNMITKWNKTTQSLTSYVQGDTGANFELEPGGVYMASVTSADDWYCCGTLTDPVTYSLSTSPTTDLNWVSIPLDQNITDAQEVIDSSQDTVSGQSMNRINFVAYYDVEDQVWKGYASYYPSSFNFSVTPGMGVLVNLTMGPYTWPDRD